MRPGHHSWPLEAADGQTVTASKRGKKTRRQVSTDSMVNTGPYPAFYMAEAAFPAALSCTPPSQLPWDSLVSVC